VSQDYADRRRGHPVLVAGSEKANQMPSHSATDEPWKEPGQTSQDHSQQPSPNVVEQEKQKKGIKDGDSPLMPKPGPGQAR
jgi:hypothetical protein